MSERFVTPELAQQMRERASAAAEASSVIKQADIPLLLDAIDDLRAQCAAMREALENQLAYWNRVYPSQVFADDGHWDTWEVCNGIRLRELARTALATDAGAVLLVEVKKQRILLRDARVLAVLAAAAGDCPYQMAREFLATLDAGEVTE